MPKSRAVSGKRTPCPLTRDEFVQQAKPLIIKVGDQLMSAHPKEFKTGSFGWYANGKMTVLVGDTPLVAQVGFSFTVVNSKPETPTEEVEEPPSE